MSIGLKKGLRIFCCLLIWFDPELWLDWRFRGREGGREEGYFCVFVYSRASRGGGNDGKGGKNYAGRE